MKRHGILVLFSVSSLIILGSCSLKYDQEKNVRDIVPEFAFTDSVMTRYEDDKKKMELKVGNLEQYKDGYSVFAKDVDFSFYEDGEVSMDGNCGYLSANTNTEVYEMFDSIKLKNHKEEMSVSGKSFHWNGKTEQLTSGRNDTVTIEKDGMTVYGSGFSASGASSAFSFTSVVTGNIETNDKEKSENGGAKNE